MYTKTDSWQLGSSNCMKACSEDDLCNFVMFKRDNAKHNHECKMFTHVKDFYQLPVSSSNYKYINTYQKICTNN